MITDIYKQNVTTTIKFVTLQSFVKKIFFLGQP